MYIIGIFIQSGIKQNDAFDLDERLLPMFVNI
jgi:hypothetical protein